MDDHRPSHVNVDVTAASARGCGPTATLYRRPPELSHGSHELRAAIARVGGTTGGIRCDTAPEGCPGDAPTAHVTAPCFTEPDTVRCSTSLPGQLFAMRKLHSLKHLVPSGREAP